MCEMVTTKTLWGRHDSPTYITAVKRIFRYLRGTVDYGLWYLKDDDFTLSAYIDADWVGDVDDRKSTSGGAFFLGQI